jgi:hypothetical protein
MAPPPPPPPPPNFPEWSNCKNISFIFRPSLVNLFLHPSTGDDDHDSKYVCLNLLLTISEKYPFLSPGISIKNPRGLSDAHVTR